MEKLTANYQVLVVDDSALMRKLTPQILESDSSIQGIGTAMDGNFGLKKIEELAPQVITLDLEMPGLNGIDTLKEIMRRWRLPVHCATRNVLHSRYRRISIRNGNP